MTEQEKEIKNRLHELAERAYSRGRFVFSTFLSVTELSVLFSDMGTLSYAEPIVFGGFEGAERAIVRFGACDYEEAFPITVIKVSPLNEKFADELTHRDYLGTLLNLGIDRSSLGDITKHGHGAYVYCLNSMAPFILENLKRVKHTDVKCEIVENAENTVREKVSESYFLSSLRADCAVAAVYKLSRDDAQAYFNAERVLVNGKICARPSKELSLGDVVAVRGKGRFTFAEIEGESRKGRLRCKIEKDK